MKCILKPAFSTEISFSDIYVLEKDFGTNGRGELYGDPRPVTLARLVSQAGSPRSRLSPTWEDGTPTAPSRARWASSPLTSRVIGMWRRAPTSSAPTTSVSRRSDPPAAPTSNRGGVLSATPLPTIYSPLGRALSLPSKWPTLPSL